VLGLRQAIRDAKDPKVQAKLAAAKAAAQAARPPPLPAKEQPGVLLFSKQQPFPWSKQAQQRKAAAAAAAAAEAPSALPGLGSSQPVQEEWWLKKPAAAPAPPCPCLRSCKHLLD